jgi:hypothetical protein
VMAIACAVQNRKSSTFRNELNKSINNNAVQRDSAADTSERHNQEKK